MGAWGPGPFENDAAADWLDALDPLTLSDGVRTALQVASDDPDDSDVASIAIAAAAVVAAIDGRAHDALPAELQSALRNHRDDLREQADAARAAIAAVGSRGGLAELWAESDAEPEWHAALRDLDERLLEIAGD